MKTLALHFIFILMLTSCGHQNSFETSASDTNTPITSNQAALPPLPGERVLSMNQHDVRNEHGTNMYSYLYPSNWKQEDQDPDVFLINENDAKVFHEITSATFSFYRSNRDNAYFKKQGSHISKVKSFEEIIDEYIRPITDSLSIELQPYVKAPSIAARKHEYYDHFISMGRPDTTTFETVLITSKDTAGLKAITYLTRTVNIYKDQTFWNFSLQAMEAPVAYFEDAKADFQENLENWLFGYEYIYQNNQYAIQAITNNRTAQYFTPKEKFIRYQRISAEQTRTGCHAHQSIQKYMQEVLTKNWDNGDFKDIPVDYSNVPDNPYQNWNAKEISTKYQGFIDDN